MSDSQIIQLTGCECPLAGFCTRHSAEKTHRLHELCRGSWKYWSYWEKQSGRDPGPAPAVTAEKARTPRVQPSPPQTIADYEAVQTAHPCAHKGDVLRQAECQLCGMRGQMFDVYACAVHGECSLIKRAHKLASCGSCMDHSERQA